MSLGSARRCLAKTRKRISKKTEGRKRRKKKGEKRDLAAKRLGSEILTSYS